jgi:hypothetical protein
MSFETRMLASVSTEATSEFCHSVAETGLSWFLSFLPLTTTTFRWDPRFRIYVPTEMKDEYPAGGNGTKLGTATYENLGRFEVRTESTVAAPNPQ